MHSASPTAKLKPAILHISPPFPAIFCHRPQTTNLVKQPATDATASFPSCRPHNSAMFKRYVLRSPAEKAAQRTNLAAPNGLTVKLYYRYKKRASANARGDCHEVSSNGMTRQPEAHRRRSPKALFRYPAVHRQCMGNHRQTRDSLTVSHLTRPYALC